MLPELLRHRLEYSPGHMMVRVPQRRAKRETGGGCREVLQIYVLLR